MSSLTDVTLAKLAARARRDDAELAEVLGVRIERLEGAAHVRDGRRRGASRALLAALVLLGVFVVIAVAFEQRCRRDEAQEPASLEPPDFPGVIRCAQRAGELPGWPADLQAARILPAAGSVLNDDLAEIARFHDLRFLGIGGEARWPLEGMAALAGMPKLEELELASIDALTPAHLALLAKNPALRFLTLGVRRSLQREEIDALAKLPALASLRLAGGRLDAAVVAHLATLPHLQQLELADLDACSEEAMVALGQVQGLRALRLEDVGHWPRLMPAEWPNTIDGAKNQSTGLTPAVARALAKLPRLRRLTLRGVETSAAAIDALPAGLEHLGLLASPQAGADVFAALMRFPHLRSVELDAGDRQAVWGGARFVAEYETAIERFFAEAPPREAVWKAQAELLRKVAPSELAYVGNIPDAVREAVAVLPLQELRLCRPRPRELALLGELPGLRRVTIDGCDLRRIDLDALVAMPNLAQLTLRWCNIWPRMGVASIEQVRESLPRTKVTTHGF